MSPKSAAKHGTLYHIRNIFAHSDIGKPSCEDFMAILMQCYNYSSNGELRIANCWWWTQSISESAWTESDDRLRQRMDAVLNELVGK